jgi:fibro-slime domain-containing protein
MKITKRSFIGWICGLALLLTTNVFSQVSQGSLKDTIWLPVTYYDFHSDHSNPEFEQAHPSVVRKGMVQSRLDKDGLPLPTTVANDILLNSYMKYWFRPFKSGDFTVPTYNGATGRLVSIVNATTDTAFKNIVIKDSLRFVRVQGTNMYRYDNAQFFPLDKYSPPASFGIENPGINNPDHNYAFTMHLSFTFTKTEEAQTFRFRGDDDVWAFIDSTLVMDIGGIHEPAVDSFTVSNNLETNKKYSFDLFFAERHTVMSSVRIETNLFEHRPPNIEIISKSGTVCPGDTVPITLNVTMDGIERPGMAKDAVWKVLPGSANGVSTVKGNLGALKGNILTFTPTIAEDSVYINASVYDTIDKRTKDTTIGFWVSKGCYADHLSIEEVKFENGKIVVNSREDNPLGELTILGDATTTTAYAVARDRYGNFVRLADSINTEWTAVDPVVTTSTNQGSAYKGIITRAADNGKTIVVATEKGLTPDDIVVNLSRDCIIALRLKDKNGKIVDTIRMTTDDRETYSVEGQKSSDKSWITTEATWQLTSPPKYTIKTPERNSIWTLDPTTEGVSTLILSRNFGECDPTPETKIPVIVTLGKIIKVELNIITPESKRIAGDTLKAEVKIYTADGLVPGSYCFGSGGRSPQKVIYNDTLRYPASRSNLTPRINVKDVWTDLNQGFTSNIKHDQCFENGIDTIQFIEYYAPFPYDRTDSLHRLCVDIGNDIKDQKDFRLIPAKADYIDITDDTLKSITSLEVYSYNQVGKTYTTIIYDRFGNTITQKPFVEKWYTTGTINNLSRSSADEFEFFPGQNAQIQTGRIVADHTMDGKNLKDSIDIRVNTIAAKLTKAVTRDTSGNGYIDMLELTFDKEVTITPDMIQDFKLTYSPTTFKVVDIVKVNDAGTRYNLIIEEENTGTPKTDLLPLLTTSAGSKAGFKDTVSLRTTDGVAPVIVSAKVVIKGVIDHSNDILTIKLSEPIKRADKQDLNVLDTPSVSFSVWYKDQTNSAFTLVKLLDSIPNYLSTGSSVVEIRMTNGRLLSTSNYINIRAETRSISDVPGNFPDTNNVKVKVEVINDIITVVPVPIPTVAAFTHTKPGEMKIEHDPLALEYAKNNQGIAFQINIPFPEVSNGEKLGCTFKVYDHVGNLVFTQEEENIVPVAVRSLKVDRENYQLDIYWNGSNKQGKAVSPGIYRVVFYFSYSMNPKNNTRIMMNIGFRK